MRKVYKLVLIFFIQFLIISCQQQEKIFSELIQPVPQNSGFKISGYWVWGGSAIKVGTTYHLFASRWPQKNNFPDDYFEESEIVHAISKSALGPYIFQEVVIGERDSTFWDSNMAHNPTIHKIGNKFVLFYIGSDFTTFRGESDRLLRRVGYATANNIEGPWQRSNVPLINEESSNPALFVEEDGSVKLLYRDEKLTVKMATAANFRGPYRIANNNVWPSARLEDFYLFKKDRSYHIICEDNMAALTGKERWGAHLVSKNGINNWQKFEPTEVYNHSIIYESGDTLHCVRRERPQLLIQNKEITHLFNGVYDGKNSWCQPVEFYPSIKVN